MKNSENIEKIFELFSKSELSEFFYKGNDFEIKIKKDDIVQKVVEKTVPVVKTKQPVIKSEHVEKVAQDNEKSDFKEIKSPIHGNFYRAPSPKASPYIQIGDVVKEGQVVCIVESMKLMNEIKSPFSGKVVDILIEDGKSVTKNQNIILLD